MVVEFDPAWEYFVADPEIEELVYRRRASGLDAIDDARIVFKGGNGGFRFGKGNPNRCNFKFGREKRRHQVEEPQPKKCPKCNCYFIPSRKSMVFCSKKCGCGADKVLPLVLKCKVCGDDFKPYWSGHCCCSRQCGGSLGAKGAKDIPDGFAEAYASDESTSSMMSRFGVTKVQIQRWRRKLGIPARPSGNHSRVKRDNT